jgi:sulfur-carrier protein
MPVVKLYANLRSVTGQKEMNVPGLKIQEVLERLVQSHPELERFLFIDGQLKPRVVVTVNGQTLDPETRFQTSVSEQDQIAIFPPVAGG